MAQIRARFSRQVGVVTICVALTAACSSDTPAPGGVAGQGPGTAGGTSGAGTGSGGAAAGNSSAGNTSAGNTSAGNTSAGNTSAGSAGSLGTAGKGGGGGGGMVERPPALGTPGVWEDVTSKDMDPELFSDGFGIGNIVSDPSRPTDL